jgi:hypothetical protein
MSLSRPDCPRCSIATECARVAWFARDRRDLFGVGWACPRCTWSKLVVSPIGPSTVDAGTCIHCGAHHEGIEPCSACGTSITEFLSSDQRAQPDEVLLAWAMDAFALGTCRLGLTLTNYVLQRNPTSAEARSIKAQFVEHLDAQTPIST